MLASERRDFEIDDGTVWPMLEGIIPTDQLLLIRSARPGLRHVHEPLPPADGAALMAHMKVKELVAAARCGTRSTTGKSRVNAQYRFTAGCDVHRPYRSNGQTAQAAVLAGLNGVKTMAKTRSMYMAPAANDVLRLNLKICTWLSTKRTRFTMSVSPADQRRDGAEHHGPGCS
jgi:hypothetical protein